MSDMLNDIFGDDFDLGAAAAEASDGEFGLIPEGWHNVEIVRTERKATKGGDGTGINIGFKTARNRWLFEYFYVATTNAEKADGVKNGRAKFAKMIKEGLGLNRMPKGLALLEGQQLAVKVKHELDNYKGEKDAKIATFGPYDPKHDAASGGNSIAANVAANRKADDFEDDIPF